MRDGYDIAQICLKGHVVNDLVRSEPGQSKKFCDECGEATITECPNCGESIEGAWAGDDYYPLREPPGYCPSCGKPYPWTATKDEKGEKPEEKKKLSKIELVQSLIEEAERLPNRDEDALDTLRKRGQMFLENICPGKSYASRLLNIDFHSHISPISEDKLNIIWGSGKKKLIHLLKTAKEEIQMFGDVELKSASETEKSNRIFIVHGHDDEMKTSAQLVLTQLGLDPIILLELPDKGRTIIEKIIDYADVHFAVVLLSPDDFGYPKNLKDKNEKGQAKPRPRARQNVIMELGFFIGKLGRENVVVIHKEISDFDFPTDISGVLYKSYDESGKWRFELVKELQAVGYKVSADKLTKK